MDCIPHYIPYQSTHSFRGITLDYILADEKLKSFYEHPVSIEGIKASIEARQKFPTNRRLLADQLEKQYEGISIHEKTQSNIRSLEKENCFTICTAHQPNLFTGYLYFVYKILHVIKLSDELNRQFPGKRFVPVFFLGSEDNDLAELNRIRLGGEPLIWETQQQGAVGRMKPEGLEPLIQRISGELSVLPHGPALIEMLKEAYFHSSTIEEASFKLVNALFGEYGLVVFLCDNPYFKKELGSIFEADLFHHVSGELVENTSKILSNSYKVQVNPREINLFYLDDNLRERIIQNGSGFKVMNTSLQFSKEELKIELAGHPERFSPNVVLRGLYQEFILPNIAFVGGGSEIAYWLELRSVFDHYKVPFPVLIMRNSFLLLKERSIKLINRLGLEFADLFTGEDDLVKELVKKESGLQLSLHHERDEMEKYYRTLSETAGKVDKTLERHVYALQTQAMKKLEGLEKKILRAEKKKFADLQNQVRELKEAVFPDGKLQERAENILPYFAQYGKEILNCIYQSSLGLEQQFTVLQIP